MVFTSMSCLHYVVLRWMFGICIGFQTKHVFLVWGCRLCLYNFSVGNGVWFGCNVEQGSGCCGLS